jgi:formate hydrogenlyase transcriptional activator
MKPFVKLNCGALPTELIEDELFGHEKGAFTGALQARKGRFEIADGGTIFLDEIGELPISLQPKLLRVLQNGEFERVGGHQTIKVDVRIIAATNRELETEVKEGRFRDDLYYRLNVFPITIPALRNRKEDVPMLVEFFVEKESRKHSKSFKNINKSDMLHLSEYDWPGNIREMRNVIERAVIISETATLRFDLFYNSTKDKVRRSPSASLEELEKDHIIKVLQESHWRISGEGSASEKLIINPSTLRSRMKKLNITRSGNEIV